MIDIRLKYLASFFSDNKDIMPTPEIISSLIEQLRSFELIPQTYQEIELPGPPPLTRLRFASQDEVWDVQFGRRRINVEKHQSDIKGTNLGGLAGFCSDTANILSKILEKYPKKANRLSLVTSCLMEEMSEPCFDHVYQALSNSPPFYRENKPFEWDWKAASHTIKDFSGMRETLNVITHLKRMSGELAVKTERLPFERIMLSQDINTAPDNSDYRFNPSHLSSFFSIAQALHEELENSILSFISE